MTNTPRTDAAEFPVMTWPTRDNPMVVRSTVAREIERELAETKAELAKWRELPDQVEKLIPCTNIPLSAAQVRTTAISQVLDILANLKGENQ
jgi:hypothetical protein